MGDVTLDIPEARGGASHSRWDVPFKPYGVEQDSAEEVGELCRFFLAGREGLVVVFKISIDESGTDDKSKMLTVGACVGHTETWVEWTKAWDIAKNPIKIFRSSDAANLEGAFQDWTEENRDEVVTKVLPVMAAYDLQGYAVGIHLDSYRAAIDANPHLKEYFPGPYSACVHWIIEMILSAAGNIGLTLAFVHEVNAMKGQAFEAFDHVVWRRNLDPNKTTLTFATKEAFAPLQAADVIAYEGNKRLRGYTANPPRKERRPWQTLGPMTHLKYYGPEHMNDLVATLEAAYRSGDYES